MGNRLGEKVFAITGAASGIGAATTELLSNAGARIAALDMKWPAAESSQNNAASFTANVDVSNDEGVEQVFADIIQHFGRLDGVATCAGVNNIYSFDQLDAAIFRRMYEVNVIGTFNCLKSAAARMKEGGRMVTVSSIDGIRGGGIFGTGAYAASKAAVIALTKNAARS